VLKDAAAHNNASAASRQCLSKKLEKWIVPLVGVDGCKTGWVAAVRAAPSLCEIRVFSAFDAILAEFPSAIIAVDMPIGLPDRVGAGGRAPEILIRPLLGARRASVFSVPARAAVEAFADGYPRVCELARATSEPPRAPSKQAFWIFPRILEIDRLLQRDRDAAERVYEVHPELAFRLMQGAPLPAAKKSVAGSELRKSLLAAHGFSRALLDRPPPKGAASDDVLDACATLWSAARIAAGAAQAFPQEPGLDRAGLRIGIWA